MDFEFYQGDNVIPYFPITDEPNGTGNPVDVSGATAATWVAVPAGHTTPIITKHLADMSIGQDPNGSSVENCIFVPLAPEDTGTMAAVGTLTHELRITLDGMQSVVYPPVGTTATFTVVESWTWDTGVTPPAPRIIEEEPVSKLKRIPKLPAKKVG